MRRGTERVREVVGARDGQSGRVQLKEGYMLVI